MKAIDLTPITRRTRMATAVTMAMASGFTYAQADITPETTLEEVMVVGSMIKASPENDTSSRPVQFISGLQIESSPAENIADLLQELPINNGFNGSAFNSEEGGGNSSINLRGVGDQFTLVLVNGRRFAGEDTPDIGAIAPAAIERIEVLKSGASAIYGSDAVAGVVNIVLKEGFRGMELRTSYGDSTRGGGETFQISSTFGLVDDNFDLTGSLTYQDRGAIFKFDRIDGSRDFRRFGGQDRRSWVGVPHRIWTDEFSDNGLSLNLDEFPAGSAPDGPEDFVPYNRDALAASTNEWSTLPASERFSGHWAGNYAVAEDKLEIFANGYFDLRQTVMTTGPGIVYVDDVPADNPYNPFGARAYAAYTFSPNESPLIQENQDTTNLRGTLGLRGEVSDRFNWEISAGRYQKVYDREVLNDIDIDAAQAAARRTDATAFNPFCNGCNTPEQLAGFSPASRFQTKDRATFFDARFSGRLFDWQAGSAYYAAGYERREISFDFQPDNISPVTNFWWWGSSGGAARGDREVDSYFAEIQLPLFKSDNSASVFHSADMAAAIRREDYSDFGDATVGQVSGRIGLWKDSVILRASFAESFRAPSVADLTRPTSTFNEASTNLFDPVRGGQLPLAYLVGGNPELGPESGESMNIGIIFKPESIPGLFASVDFFTLDIEDVIFFPDAQALLNGTASGGSITRDPDTLFPTLDVRPANGQSRENAGFDIAARYLFEVGTFGTLTASANVTRLTEFKNSADGNTDDILDTISGNFGPVPKWRGVVGLDWDYRNLNATLRVHHLGSYRDIVPGFVDRRADDFQKVDLHVNYDLSGLNEGLQVFVGAENLLNERVPFVASDANGWDRSQADYRGQYVYGGVRKRF